MYGEVNWHSVFKVRVKIMHICYNGYINLYWRIKPWAGVKIRRYHIDKRRPGDSGKYR